ncbi:hypothetical protein V8E53_007162 [Lactarius tabidus]
MPPNHVPFPEPTFPAGVTVPPSNEEDFYPGPVQHSRHNSHLPGPYTGSTSSHSHSPSPYPNTALPGPHPAFPVPLGQECQAVRQPSPSYYFPEQNIPYPQSHSGVSGADQFQAAHQIYPDDLGGQMYEGHETSSIYGGHQLARSPGAHPISGRPQDITDDGKQSLFTRLFGKQTVEHPVKESQLSEYPCRWPGCKTPVRSDQLERLGGFCCDTQMWEAIHNNLVTLCCCRRICPEGKNYCSAHCANGRQ